MSHHERDNDRLKLEHAIYADLARALTSTLDLSQVLRIIMEKVRELLKPRNWSLLLMEPDGQSLRFEIIVGEGADLLKGRTLTIGEGIAGWVARTGESLLVQDAQNDHRFCKRFDEICGFTTRSIIAVPLKNKGKVLGVIELINRMEAGYFSDLDRHSLETIAEYAAIAIDNAALFQQVRRLVITDDHTSLYNIRHLYEVLDRELAEAAVKGHEVSMIFFDLDHFKKVDDTYGHLAGSQVLREVGMLLKELVRPGDVPVRYGGDEFIVLMPRTTKEEALAFAESLRISIKTHEFLAEEDLHLHITASYGVAAYPRDASDKNHFVNIVDATMYKVKESTRDAVAGA
jgi:diguanylate cyclase (GGDEF)-like protein